MGENLTNYFKALFDEAHRKTLLADFVQADDICYQLLSEPTLPLLYRAGCNLMLSFGDDNPVDFAKEAVSWYQEMYGEVKDDPTDGPHHLELLNLARDTLIEAERRIAEDDDDENERGEIDRDTDDDEEEGATEAEEQGQTGEEEVKGGVEVEGEPEADDDIKMLSRTDVEEAEELTAPSSSLPTIAPDPDLVMGAISSLPIQSSQATQVDDTATQEEKKTESDEE